MGLGRIQGGVRIEVLGATIELVGRHLQARCRVTIGELFVALRHPRPLGDPRLHVVGLHPDGHLELVAVGRVNRLHHADLGLRATGHVGPREERFLIAAADDAEQPRAGSEVLAERRRAEEL